MYVQRTIEVHSRNNCCLEKARSTAYSECMSLALVIQHEMCMCRVIPSSVAYLAVPHLSRLQQKRQDFCKKVTNIKVCFDFLYKYRLKYFSFEEEFRGYYHKYV
jgi:hypothetical protein